MIMIVPNCIYCVVQHHFIKINDLVIEMTVFRISDRLCLLVCGACEWIRKGVLLQINCCNTLVY